MRIAYFFTLLLGFVLGKELQYSPAPPDNPLKGLVPYASEWKRERFPHSMEFAYLPLSDLMKGWGKYDWSGVEALLEGAKSRGKQSVFRVYLEFPGKKLAVPDFLITEGLKIDEWNDDRDGSSFTPDYEDENLRRAMREFIRALGQKYDGDPRVAYLTAGMLGKWGEWHNYPRGELWASKEVQREVMHAFDQAFGQTHVLLRYPAGRNDDHYADNRTFNFGYHDDSFGWATLVTGKEGEEWFFMNAMERYGLTEKWKRFPIGGEVRPEIWKTTFTDKVFGQQQDFLECVEKTHVTWLMDSGVFQNGIDFSEERKARAIKAVQRMGYEFFVKELKLDEKKLTLVMENRGVAPFPYDWPVELVVSAPEREAKPLILKERLTQILPGSPATWTVQLPIKPTQVQLRIPNPMEGGIPLRFANKESDGEWLKIDF